MDRVERAVRFDPAWLGSNWDALVTRWHALGQRGAVVGPHGSGKTTFLEGFEEVLGGRWVRVSLNDERPVISAGEWARFAAADHATTVAVDGAERLGWRAWRRLARVVATRRAGLVTTQHAPGRLPVLLETRTGEAMLAAFADRLAPGEIPAAEIAPLYHRHGGNLREALGECYDRMAAK